MLTTCSADGVVRIYEAPDVMNLSQWSLQHEISCKLSCSCISWNPSRLDHSFTLHQKLLTLTLKCVEDFQFFFISIPSCIVFALQ